jgi:hypothetical protein
MSRPIALAALLCTVAFTTPAFASSHREAPLIANMAKVDNTDVYAFRSYEPGRSDYVTLIANFIPDQGPGNGPNYYTMDPDAVYEIHVDSDGDARENLTFQFRFSNRMRDDTGITLNVGGKTLPIALRKVGPITDANSPTLGETESYTLTQVIGNRRTGTREAVTTTGGSATFFKPFDNAGNKTIADYPAYARQFIYETRIPGCAAPGRVFAGQRAEYFAVNLGPVFDLVNFVPIVGDNDPVYGNGSPFPGGIIQSSKNQELIGKRNVTSLALEVPIACLKRNGNGAIGVWSSVSLPQSRLLKTNPTHGAPTTNSGNLVQVSRLGMPLVNELVIGLPKKNLFNASEPAGDGQFIDFVTNPTFPAILNALFRDPVNATLGTNIPDLAPTNFPRGDLVTTFLTGFEGLNQLSVVTGSEMLRLNMLVPATPRSSQKTLGVLADDLAGFPNGRRPGDDVVDIVLRVAMGRLCHPVTLGGNTVSLGLCAPADASTGLVAYTDGAPSRASSILNAFPYLNPPLRGSPRPQTQP